MMMTSSSTCQLIVLNSWCDLVSRKRAKRTKTRMWVRSQSEHSVCKSFVWVFSLQKIPPSRNRTSDLWITEHGCNHDRILPIVRRVWPRAHQFDRDFSLELLVSTVHRSTNWAIGGLVREMCKQFPWLWFSGVNWEVRSVRTTTQD